MRSCCSNHSRSLNLQGVVPARALFRCITEKSGTIGKNVPARGSAGGAWCEINFVFHTKEFSFADVRAEHVNRAPVRLSVGSKEDCGNRRGFSTARVEEYFKTNGGRKDARKPRPSRCACVCVRLAIAGGLHYQRTANAHKNTPFSFPPVQLTCARLCYARSEHQLSINFLRRFN